MSEYIKKDLLKLAVIEALNEPPFSNSKFERANALISVIDKFPAADVEPVVRGEWIEMRDPYGDLTGWIHEECGRETNAATEYCSKCGAKMTFVERSGSGE